MAKIVDACGKIINALTPSKSKKEEKEEPLFIQTPVFILFAEILGYVSPFLEYAEDWCNPEKPMPLSCIKTFLEREAKVIYDDMLAEFTEEEIHQLYVNFYNTGLDYLDEDLKEKNKAMDGTLPF